ncbi:hypothetical protein D5S17_34895 [Pseudonocardiaceae bacterium YIM PH 21723]|nr:hypothetical protein D5S17_34895 [Pseudonocardiaceae bacterium YIM PH 21723]
MNESDQAAIRRLSIALRLTSIVTLIIFVPWHIGLLFDWDYAYTGHPIGQLFAWGPHDGGRLYAQMITAIYIVWGIFIWLAAKDPVRNRLFVDFTIFGNLIHGLVMLIQGVLVHSEHVHLMGDVPLCFAVLLLLGPLHWPLQRRLARA